MIGRPAHREFREGDEVVLAAGEHQGTAGIFLSFQDDVRWADIVELSGVIRGHPVAWLAFSQDVIRKPGN